MELGRVVATETLVQLETRAAAAHQDAKIAARKFAASVRGRKLLATLAKGDVVAGWNSDPLKHLATLGLVSSHNLLQTNGRLAISKRWSITTHGRDVAGAGA